jgi:hypothetical protein
MKTSDFAAQAERLWAETPWWRIYSRWQRRADMRFWQRQCEMERSDDYCDSVASAYLEYQMPCELCRKELVLTRIGPDRWAAQPHRCAFRFWSGNNRLAALDATFQLVRSTRGTVERTERSQRRSSASLTPKATKTPPVIRSSR